MFIDRELIISLPVFREADTISARPNLASQAPMVSITMHEDAKGIIFNVSVSGTINTKLKVIPSKASKDIRRCLC